MRAFVHLLTGLVLFTTVPVSAEPASPAGAKPAVPAEKPKAHYSTTETELGVLLDDPAAKAIVEKHIPGLTTNDQVDLARAMTLKDIQAFSPDDVTDERLAAIDAELAKL
jgi:para-nitrobenzyl esterase